MASNIVSARSALLAVLLRGEGYGLELIERIEKRTGGRIALRQAAVYPALRQLEADGLVRSWEGEPIPERGGRPRRYYRLTAAGERTARAERIAMARLSDDNEPTPEGEGAHAW